MVVAGRCPSSTSMGDDGDGERETTTADAICANFCSKENGESFCDGNMLPFLDALSATVRPGGGAKTLNGNCDVCYR